MTRRPLLFFLAPLAAGLLLAGPGALLAAGPQNDDAEYSSGVSKPSSPSSLPATPKDSDQPRITIENFGKPSPEQKPAASPAPAPSAPAQSRSPTEPPAASSPPTAAPAPASLPKSSSPIMNLVESTLRGDFAGTKALKERLPRKTFSQSFNHAAANALSRKGNELLNKMNDPAGAVAAYEQAYANDRSSSEITGSYGYALFRNGRYAEARDIEIESLEISPGYGAAWFVLGEIFGFLQQEDYAYASFVNTCLFTKNINTTLNFLENKTNTGYETCVQNAAAKALATCRAMAAGASATPAATESSPSRREESVQAGRIGKVDVKSLILGSRPFVENASRLAAMRGMSEQERDNRMRDMVMPILVSIREQCLRYARTNRYQIILVAEAEQGFRNGRHLQKDDFILSEPDPAVLAFLDSDKGKAFRRTAPIDDVTPSIRAMLGNR